MYYEVFLLWMGGIHTSSHPVWTPGIVLLTPFWRFFCSISWFSLAHAQVELQHQTYQGPWALSPCGCSPLPLWYNFQMPWLSKFQTLSCELGEKTGLFGFLLWTKTWKVSSGSKLVQSWSSPCVFSPSLRKNCIDGYPILLKHCFI